MKSYIFIVCFRVIQLSIALFCQDNQLVVELPNGNLICAKCSICPPGFGATVPCGRTNIVPYNVSVTCKACPPEQYSDSLSLESCKPCSKCLPDEAIVAQCTNISDRRCSCKPCPKGYYRNKTISKCLPCSGCCLDGIDEVVSECVDQRLPPFQTCSYQNRKPCGSKCWYDEITVLKPDGKHSCQPCPVCAKDMGLTVPCGGLVRDEMLIGCELPAIGKTFVGQQGALQSCGTCSPGQDVVTNCSYKSDTLCGGCKKGFYYNYHSKSCQECFWCCNHGDSERIMKCIKEGMLFAESREKFLIKQVPLSLHVNTQSGQVHQDYFLKSLLKLDNLTLTTGFIIIVCSYLALNSAFRRRKNSKNIKIQKPDVNPSLEKIEDKTALQRQHCITKLDVAQDTSQDTKKVESEYPVQENPGHVLFEKTGVEAIAHGKNKSTIQLLLSHLALQATSNSTKPGFLEKDEILLSPVITFILATKLNKSLEVQIPHGANVILSRAKWNVMLKELLNNRWVTVSHSGQRIKNFVTKSNHVSFEANHLSTFAVVGKLSNHSLPAFKRMKVAAFCSETSIGEDLVVRLYCFDDCEYSFEKLMKKEQEEGGKLISSIESLDFSVTSENDVEITIKDIEGWQLDQASSMKFSNTLLRNSFEVIPQCDLVFHPNTKPGKSSFFVVVALTYEPTSDTSQTVMYASTAIKKDPSVPRIRNYLNGVHRDDVVSIKAGRPVNMERADSDKCIIQM